MPDQSFIAIVADSLGLKPTEDATKTLAPDVEYRLREIIQEAAKFARHSKRTLITPEDINHACRLKNIQPVYGFSSSTDPSRFIRASTHPDVSYADDPVIPLSTILEQPLPPVPWEAGVKIHWLAVDGVQPKIPENVPLVAGDETKAKSGIKRRREEIEAQVLVAPPPSTSPEDAAAAAAAGAAAHAEGIPADGTLVRLPLRHLVSSELQSLYHTITSTLMDSPVYPPATPNPRLHTILAALQSDAALQPLLPYLSHFLKDKTAENIEAEKAENLVLLMVVVQCLSSNIHIEMGSVLHEIIPCVMTCLLAKNLGGTDDKGTRDIGARHKRDETAKLLTDNAAVHWKVRETASSALSSICRRYPDVAARIQRQLVNAVVSSSNALLHHTTNHLILLTLYGGVLGLEAQGPRATKTLLIPNLIPLMAAIREGLMGKRGSTVRIGAIKVREVALRACGYAVYLAGNGSAAKQQALDSAKEKRKSKNTASARKVATVTASDVEALRKKGAVVAEGQGIERSASARGRKGSRPGSAAAASKKGGGRGSKANAAPAVDEVFSAQGDEEEDADGAVEKVNDWMKQSSDSALHMNLGNALAENGKGAGTMSLPALPTTNYLADAWREDFPAEVLQRGMEEVFGEDVEPYKEKFAAVDDGLALV